MRAIVGSVVAVALAATIFLLLGGSDRSDRATTAAQPDGAGEVRVDREELLLPATDRTGPEVASVGPSASHASPEEVDHDPASPAAETCLHLTAVVLSQSLAPVEGAEVALFLLEDGTLRDFLDTSSDPAVEDAHEVRSANDDGEVEFWLSPDVLGDAALLVGVRPRSTAPVIDVDDESRQVFVRVSGTSIGVTLRVFQRPGDAELYRFLVGHVIDDEGRPVAGAWVTASPVEPRPAQGLLRGNSRADGFFALGPVRKDAYTVRATVEGRDGLLDARADQVVPGEYARLVMLPGATASLHLAFGDVGPLDEIDVWLVSKDEKTVRRATLQREAPRTFHASGLAEGVYDLFVYDDPHGYAEVRDLDVADLVSLDLLTLELERVPSVSVSAPRHVSDGGSLVVRRDGRLVRSLALYGEQRHLAVPPGKLELVLVHSGEPRVGEPPNLRRDSVALSYESGFDASVTFDGASCTSWSWDSFVDAGGH